MNNLVMTIEKVTNSNKNIDNSLDKNLEKIENNFNEIVDVKCFKKKVTFSNNVETKFVDKYIKDMDKILISKNDLISTLNIIKTSIFRKSFKTNEIKIVVDFYNKLNNMLNEFNC